MTETVFKKAAVIPHKLPSPVCGGENDFYQAKKGSLL
jgi:hypothetical protein